MITKCFTQNPDYVYETEFLGNDEGLITFEEYLAIIHLLQSNYTHTAQFLIYMVLE